MAGRRPSNTGLLIRDVLRKDQPTWIADIGKKVNAMRKEKGVKRISYHSINRYIREAREQGLIVKVSEVGKSVEKRIEAHPELSYKSLVRIKRGMTMDERWELLPKLVAGKEDAAVQG